jgi:hypothetical protein
LVSAWLRFIREDKKNGNAEAFPFFFIR